MVFSGAWNGGERIFHLRRGQRLTFERLLREDPGDASAREVRRGSLDEVDRWSFADARTLRWRSRAPGDPEFDGTEIVYVLEYVLSGVLVPEGDRRYRLSHDFAFPDREWPIERFTARLTLDPAWQVESGAPLTMEARDLAPGVGFVATLDLVRDAASPPLQVRARGAPVAVRIALAVFFALVLSSTAFVIIRHARARGQCEPLPGGIDEAWLREHVFAFPPEVIGAAWDRTVSAPEVSAVLARMAMEGKIQGRVTSVRSWFGRTPRAERASPVREPGAAHRARAGARGRDLRGRRFDRSGSPAGALQGPRVRPGRLAARRPREGGRATHPRGRARAEVAAARLRGVAVRARPGGDLHGRVARPGHGDGHGARDPEPAAHAPGARGVAPPAAHRPASSSVHRRGAPAARGLGGRHLVGCHGEPWKSTRSCSWRARRSGVAVRPSPPGWAGRGRARRESPCASASRPRAPTSPGS